MDASINFTPEKFKKFKKAYNGAVEAGEQDFMFEGKMILTDYGKYMIEYLEPKFKNIK